MFALSLISPSLIVMEMTLEGNSSMGCAGSRVSISSMSAQSSDFSDYNKKAHDDEEGAIDPAEAQRRHEEFERRRQEHYKMKEALLLGRKLAESDTDDDSEQM